ncbi:hypothetical protein LCGC14_1314960 [marine sediment metagenome]|uniref:Tail assembly chaperone n=1 Tax=marine sediment metagenome TaxID=412755 RepID=A0A0F9NNL8_9ZZZZ
MATQKPKPKLETELGTDEEATPLTRDEIRAMIFRGDREFRTEQLVLFGAKVDFRQPTLGAILGAKQEENRAKAVAEMLIRYCFVPGTKEQVFEDADIDTILGLPFGEDLQKANDAIERLTGIDVQGEEENSEATRDSTTS